MSGDIVELAKRDLERSGITGNQAARAGIDVTGKASEIYEDFHALPALVIPYIDPLTRDFVRFERRGAAQPFVRVRYLATPDVKPGFQKPKIQRYGQPADSGCRAYFPIARGLKWSRVFENTDIPIVITEGEKKALRAALAGLPTIGLGGVFNFMREGQFLPELQAIEWRDRPVYICFDSDAAENPNIQAAEGRLATELSLNRKASVFLVRIPEAGDGEKVGIDDFIVQHGEDALFKLLEGAPQMRKVDAAVVGLNEHVAWIEKDGNVFDLRMKEMIGRDNFTNGSRYSALEVITPTPKGQVKRVSVAKQWLTHPHAQRYDEMIFQPESAERVVSTDNGGLALNLWEGWHPKPGDVEPFLELNDFITSEMEPEHRDLPFNLMAYKAQNPGEKIPLAVMFVGTQGSGKTMWCNCIRDAFAPYGMDLMPRALRAEFNGWLERCLLLSIQEVRGTDVSGPNLQTLHSVISDPVFDLNEKFRRRQVNVPNRALVIMTANDRAAASFGADDRRFIVVSAPEKPKPFEFYDRVGRWMREGGPKALLDYLLNYDLKGWRPPNRAPMTAEKYMAYMENLSAIERIAEEAKTADENIIVMWIRSALEWAAIAEGSGDASRAREAQMITDSLSRMQIRPYYTPEELAMIFPHVAVALHHDRRLRSAASGEISRQLRNAGITYLRSKDDPRGFWWKGRIRQFLVIAEPEEWTVPISQNEFERQMNSWPRFGEMG